MDMSTKPLNHEEAINKVHDYLLGLSDAEFDKLLSEHADGDFAVMLRETGALRVRGEPIEETAGGLSTLPVLAVGNVSTSEAEESLRSRYSVLVNAPLLQGTLIQNDLSGFLVSLTKGIIINAVAASIPVSLDYLAGFNNAVGFWGRTQSILFSTPPKIQSTVTTNKVRHFVCREESDEVEDFECKAA